MFYKFHSSSPVGKKCAMQDVIKPINSTKSTKYANLLRPSLFFCAFAYLEFKFTYQDIIRIVKRYKSVQARNNGLSLQKKTSLSIHLAGRCRVER